MKIVFWSVFWGYSLFCLCESWTFQNLCSFKLHFHIHGVREVNSSDSVAAWPGLTQEYVYEVPDAAGPGPGDLSSRLWLYGASTGLGGGNEEAWVAFHGSPK